MGLRNQVKNTPGEVNGGGTNGAGGEGGEGKKEYTDEDYDRLDVEELPIEGWSRVRDSGRIVELGTLGEGAGGAVTKCVLKGGKTVFALKVSFHSIRHSLDILNFFFKC